MWALSVAVAQANALCKAVLRRRREHGIEHIDNRIPAYIRDIPLRHVWEPLVMARLQPELR